MYLSSCWDNLADEMIESWMKWSDLHPEIVAAVMVIFLGERGSKFEIRLKFRIRGKGIYRWCKEWRSNDIFWGVVVTYDVNDSYRHVRDTHSLEFQAVSELALDYGHQHDVVRDTFHCRLQMVLKRHDISPQSRVSIWHDGFVACLVV